MLQKINVNFRLDKKLKEEASLLAQDMWVNLTTVVNIFLTKFTKERKLDIDLSDNFTSLSDSEISKVKDLPNFNKFMSSVKWK